MVRQPYLGHTHGSVQEEGLSLSIGDQRGDTDYREYMYFLNQTVYSRPATQELTGLGLGAWMCVSEWLDNSG